MYQTSGEAPEDPQVVAPSVPAQVVEPVTVPLPMAIAPEQLSFAGVLAAKLRFRA